MSRLIPSVSPPLVMGLAIFNVGVTSLMEPSNRRMWVLSGLVTPLLAAIGCAAATDWLWDGTAAADHLYYDAIAELMKAYFLVDLAYCAVFHWSDTSLLDCWGHHIFYFLYLDWLRQTDQTAVIQPFLIMELPTAIRTAGVLIPAWKWATRPLFFWSFVVFRVIWPAWVLSRVWMTSPNFIVALAALALHCYWLGAMIRARPPPQPVAPLLAWRW